MRSHRSFLCLLMSCALTQAWSAPNPSKTACGVAYDRFYTPNIGNPSADMSSYYAINGVGGIGQACINLGFSVADRTRTSEDTALAIRGTTLTAEAYGDLAGRLTYRACVVNTGRTLGDAADYAWTRSAFVQKCPFPSLSYSGSQSEQSAPAASPAQKAVEAAGPKGWQETLWDHIAARWVAPAGLPQRPNIMCVASVALSPTGEVLDAKIIGSSNDPAFDQSVQAAIRAASPLPLPTDPFEWNERPQISFQSAHLLQR